MNISFAYWIGNTKFAPTIILRGGAVVARWAHNPKVGGSNPPSATKKKPDTKCPAFLFSDLRPLARRKIAYAKSRDEYFITLFSYLDNCIF
jgi:hypothetical protein